LNILMLLEMVFLSWKSYKGENEYSFLFKLTAVVDILDINNY